MPRAKQAPATPDPLEGNTPDESLERDPELPPVPGEENVRARVTRAAPNRRGEAPAESPAPLPARSRQAPRGRAPAPGSVALAQAPDENFFGGPNAPDGLAPAWEGLGPGQDPGPYGTRDLDEEDPFAEEGEVLNQTKAYSKSQKQQRVIPPWANAYPSGPARRPPPPPTAHSEVRGIKAQIEALSRRLEVLLGGIDATSAS